MQNLLLFSGCRWAKRPLVIHQNTLHSSHVDEHIRAAMVIHIDEAQGNRVQIAVGTKHASDLKLTDYGWISARKIDNQGIA